MSQTPSQLVEHGVYQNLGTAKLPRGLMSYRDRATKKYFLRVGWILQASKALPRMGDPDKWRRESASQQLMGDMLGQDRSTTNRDIALFAGEDAIVYQFFNKWRPGIGVANKYSERSLPLQEDKKPLCRLDPKKLADCYGEAYFNSTQEGCNGSGDVEMWTYAPEIPKPIRCGCRLGQMKLNFSSTCGKCGGKGFRLHDKKKLGANPRIILTALQLKGIKLRGYLDMTCEDLGQLTGLSVNCVAECLDQWEDLKILQIVPGEVLYDDAGKPYFRYPQRILWLPGVLLDQQMIERERARFSAHMAACQQKAQINGWANARVHLDRIRLLHTELLRRWAMTRHTLGSFWNAMRTLIYREGMPCGRRTFHGHDLRDELFPVFRE